MRTISVIMPARNEADSVGEIVTGVRAAVPGAEIIVVDDGSEDATARVAVEAGAEVVRHPYAKGNGAAIKSGARAAKGDTLVFIDADGQHNPADIPRLLARLEEDYDMVIGARRPDGHSGLWRRFANAFYSRFASWMVGHEIPDLTSGFRVVDANRFKEFLYMLPNGFSYPTTITMAFFRSGYSVKSEFVEVKRCTGGSHISLTRDGLKFVLIIFRVGTLYSPLKIFFPLALLQFAGGLLHYMATYVQSGRFTNMSALLLTSSLTVFLVGLVSEQIASLQFRRNQDNGA